MKRASDPGTPTGRERETYRILFLVPNLNRYGVGKSMLGLAKALTARGHKVCCAADAAPNVVEEWRGEGLCFLQLPQVSMNRSSLMALTAIIPLLKIIRRKRVQIVHSHHRRTSVLASLIQPWIKLPVVATCHIPLEGRRSISLWGDKVICVSESCQRRMEDYFGVKPERTVLIHNGIDVRMWRNLRSNVNGSSLGANKSPCITNIARLAPEKDQGTLLRAMALILEKHPGARLKLVGSGAGSGPLEAELKALADQLGITASVDFVGEVGDVKPVLSETDVFVLSSIKEGLPMALLEAMAASVPVVVTRVDGMPALVRHGQTGRVTETQDFRRMAEEIDFVLSHPEQAREMCQMGRELVEREFSLDQMASQVEAVYHELLTTRKAR